jgi:NADH-quinone oxidoreductase subunit M
MMMEQWVLTLMTFVPLLGAAVITFLPKAQHNLIRWTAAAFAAVPLALALWIWQTYNRAAAGVDDLAGFQYVVRLDWIPGYHIQYFMGVDGLSVPMVLLTALLSFLCIFASWGITKQLKGYFALFLLLETGMIGTFVSLDFILFYVFWEIMLLPMYFLIGIWGGPRREYAAIKFFLYTLAGSVLMLVGILALYFQGGHTFSLLELMAQARTFADPGLTIFGLNFARVIFVAFFIGFAIKVPMWPFHTWLPDAHVEAPTAISVILAGVLLKMGTYGMMRISLPIFPGATQDFAFGIAVFGVINILYGAYCAMAQSDLKKLVAYSSVSHMGYVLLGMAALTPQGMTGAALQMFNHGTITAMMFLLVGVIYDRAHHRDIDGFGGIGAVTPVYTGVAMLAFFASMGLPGLSGFVSEVMVFLGAFQAYKVLTFLAALGIILTAGYLLWMIKRVFLGALNEKYAALPEINGRELFTLVPIGLIVLFLGIYPLPVLDLMSNSTARLVQLVTGF